MGEFNSINGKLFKELSPKRYENINDFFDEFGIDPNSGVLLPLEPNDQRMLIDIDSCGMVESLFVEKGDEKLGNNIIKIDFQPQNTFLWEPAGDEKGEYGTGDLATFSNHGRSWVYITDMNGDGRKDIAILKESRYKDKIEYSAKVFLNETKECSLDKYVHKIPKRQKITGVPDYERTGLVEIGYGAASETVFRNGALEDRLMQEWVQSDTLSASAYLRRLKETYGKRSWQELTPRPIAAPFMKMLNKLLPEHFFVSMFSDKEVKGSRSTMGRLEAEGVELKLMKDEDWSQDRREYVLDRNGRTVNAMAGYSSDAWSGGDISYTRNKNGEMFVTISEGGLRSLQFLALRDKGRSPIYSEMIKEFAARMGVDEAHVIVLPRVGEYVHLDQQVFFAGDGKAIAMRLPADDPEYGAWEAAVKDLQGMGFDVERVDMPKYFVEQVRSPLNILVTDGVYFVPEDPVMILDPVGDRLADLRSGKIYRFAFGYGSNEMEEVEKDENKYFTDSGFKFIDLIYDADNEWPHIKQIRAALLKFGIPADKIKTFQHNGFRHGSLHCQTNVRPK